MSTSWQIYFPRLIRRYSIAALRSLYQMQEKAEKKRMGPTTKPIKMLEAELLPFDPGPGWGLGLGLGLGWGLGFGFTLPSSSPADEMIFKSDSGVSSAKPTATISRSANQKSTLSCFIIISFLLLSYHLSDGSGSQLKTMSCPPHTGRADRFHRMPNPKIMSRQVVG
jgi:hypothetical protein